MHDNWHKKAIMYAIDVKLFKDDTGNGFGDFRGLINKLEYIENLGINCIWLLPFYPSPLKDYGYDVVDYYNVDERLGNLGDFTEFLHKAHSKGIRVITDLVVNHTSIDHPWFKSARADRNSPFRDYYVWHDDPPKENETKIMFEGLEDSIWEYTEETQSYYLHRFFKEQADLNLTNPKVREEVMKIMRFWLQLGVDGFRIDAAHIITDPVEVEHIDFSEIHLLFDEMREFKNSINPEAVFIGEANVPVGDFEEYFKNERMDLLFNFYTNKYNFLAFARDKGTPILKALEILKKVEHGQWINFIRHHDELNLEMLDDDERQEVFDVFAPEEEMRIFGDNGIRRNLAPMLNNNRKEVELMYAVTFSLPGTPLIAYGEELMTGDDLSLHERMSVRIPMHWDNTKNAGFSEADEDKLYQKPIKEGEFSYKEKNVQDQLVDPDSFLNWMIKLIKIRSQYPEFGMGTCIEVKTDTEEVASWGLTYNENVVLVISNFSGEDLEVTLKPDFSASICEDIFSDSEYDDVSGLKKIPLKAFGYRWLKVYDAKVNED